MIRWGTEAQLEEQRRIREQLAAGEVELDLPWSPRPFSGVRPEDAGL